MKFGKRTTGFVAHRALVEEKIKFCDGSDITVPAGWWVLGGGEHRRISTDAAFRWDFFPEDSEARAEWGKETA